MSTSLVILLTFFGTIFVAIWRYIRNRYNYWDLRGVPCIRPVTIPYGNLKGIGKSVHMMDFMRDIYLKYKGTAPFIGGYFFCEPVAFILDLDLIKNILIKDFSSFINRKVYYDEKIEPLSAMMFSLDGEKWQLVRQKLSPTFTSGRMKQMFPMAAEIAGRFVDVLSPIVGNGAIIEIKDLLSRYMIDTAGTIIYGIECNTMIKPDNDFAAHAKGVFGRARHGELVRIFMESYPEIARFFRMKIFPDDISEFFLGIIRENIEYREKNEIHRNDFMDLLIQLKNTGRLEGYDGELGKLSYEEIAAQAFVFFVGSYETTASTIGYALYSLALNQDIQDKVRQEISEVLEKSDGKITYDGIMAMKYLHKIMDETLRMYSQATYIFRKVENDYKIPNTDFMLEKGLTVVIPVVGFNSDPEVYPNPEVFNPENFSAESIAQRNSFSYMPFGDGPRNCIGSRLAKMLTYLGLVNLLTNFRFKPSPKTPIPLEYEPDVQVLKTTTDFYFYVEKL